MITINIMTAENCSGIKKKFRNLTGTFISFALLATTSRAVSGCGTVKAGTPGWKYNCNQ